VLLSLCNNSENLYVLFRFNNPEWARAIRMGGVTLWLDNTGKKVVFHDPCELGRVGGVYEEPRSLLSRAAALIEPDDAKEDGLCCGSSLANTKLTNDEEKTVAEDALDRLLAKKPDVLVTACPLCKKTFEKVPGKKVRVMDISEFLAE